MIVTPVALLGVFDSQVASIKTLPALIIGTLVLNSLRASAESANFISSVLALAKANVGAKTVMIAARTVFRQAK